MDFLIARLHVDFGLFENNDSKELIVKIFKLLGEKSVIQTINDIEVLLSKVDNISDEILFGKFIKVHNKGINIINKESKKTSKEEVPNAYEELNFYYHIGYFLLFIEEKPSYGLDRKKVAKYFSQLLLKGFQDFKDINASNYYIPDVNLSYIGDKVILTEKIYSFKKIFNARFVLFPSNPSERNWAPIDNDLKSSQVEKRTIIDKAKPDGSLDYKKEGTNAHAFITMVEDGYGIAKIKGIDKNDEKLTVNSDDLAERLVVDKNDNKETILEKIIKKAFDIFERNKK